MEAVPLALLLAGVDTPPYRLQQLFHQHDGQCEPQHHHPVGLHSCVNTMWVRDEAMISQGLRNRATNQNRVAKIYTLAQQLFHKHSVQRKSQHHHPVGLHSSLNAVSTEDEGTFSQQV